MVPPWSLLLLVALAAALQCPDGTTCGEETLCCELPNGKGYGCCPENEVMSHSLPMITSGVLCSADKGCPEEYSCVGTPQGGSACCPFTQGTSCQDGHHCCPSGSHCSEDGHSCFPASNVSAIVCPDGSSECPNDATCCQMADQSWGCCPIPQATCCNDHLHCCPHASVCDLEHGKCVSENGEVPLSKKVPARVKLFRAILFDFTEIVQKVTCPDRSSCPDGTTCCPTVDKRYGCCPFLSAVCCDDFTHCCPSGTTCDVSHKKCVNANFEIPMYSKIPALYEEADVKCDDTASCPGTATCCRLPSGEWGCCPYEKAVCCDDHQHCCPNGFTCVEGDCQQEALSVPWSEKIPAVKQKTTVKCDDTASCPGTATCCRLPSGEWGCCPYEKAVCCDDHEHCCPNGFTCVQGDCQQEALSVPWSEKIPALKQKSNVQCDDETSCPDKNTCCRLPSGEWGCCPHEQAVCCTDHLHCCPSGYTCDVEAGSCNKPSGALKKATPVQPLGYVWCDSSHACYDGQTCCLGIGGIWTCCPYTQGVCCPDRVHCCPYGHVCLNQGAQCSRSGSLQWNLPWEELKPRL
ncbi:progranulin isoform X2 [Bufo bufo]|uniref:progranulin isoform X2 n=1 Tax=Bufo bufo TaxID=8384 RepID=UPI001ABDC34F|nr:progranulin isoform X2 [Bufo bufo]